MVAEPEARKAWGEEGADAGRGVVFGVLGMRCKTNSWSALVARACVAAVLVGRESGRVGWDAWRAGR